MNPHIFFLGAVEAGRLVARHARSADPNAPVAGGGDHAAAPKRPTARFWARPASR